MEEAILEGLIKAIQKGYRADSSYKAKGWKLALNYTLAVANQAVNLKHVKSKHNSHKKDWKTWKELYTLSSWGWDKAKSMPIASEEVIDVYFNANPEAVKFCNTPPAFLNILQELFKGVLATESNIKSINKAIESCIDLELLATAALQATDLIDKEGKEESKKESKEDFKSELARNSIKYSQSSSPSVGHLNTPLIIKSSSLTPSRASSLAIRKRAIKQATREAKSNSKRQQTRQVINSLKKTVEQITKEMRATRQLITQKSPQEKASMEFIEEFSHLDLAEQLVVLRAFETESTARLFLMMAGVAKLRRSLINNILTSRKDD